MYLNVFMLTFSLTVHFAKGRKLIKYLICIYIKYINSYIFTFLSSEILFSLYSDFSVENICFGAVCHI